MEIVPTRKFLQVERLSEAGREDARAEDLRCEVNALSNKQVQLLQLQVQTAQYSKAYIDERICSAANEARNNAEALGLAVTQVHTDQIVMKEHLGSHLQAVEDFVRRHTENVAQDLGHRQFLAIGAVDRRLDELAATMRSNGEQIVSIRAGQEETLAGLQSVIHQRMHGLEASTTQAIQNLEGQVALLKGDKKPDSGGQLVFPALEEIKKNLQLRLFEASATSSKAVSEAEARMTAWMRKELSKLAISGSVQTLEEKVSAQALSLQERISIHDRTVRSLEEKLSAQDRIVRSLEEKLSAQDRTVRSLEEKISAQDREIAMLRSTTNPPLGDDLSATYDERFAALDVGIHRLEVRQGGLERQEEECIDDLEILIQDRIDAMFARQQVPQGTYLSPCTDTSNFYFACP
jgi:hypothetical protein